MGTSLEKVQPPQGAASLFDPASVQAQVWASFPLDTPEGKVKLLTALQGADVIAIADQAGLHITVRHVVAHTVQLTDEKTGETYSADRIVLEDTTGSQYACVSDGVRRSLQLIAALFGAPPWEAGLKLKVERKKTKSGRYTLLLTPVL